MAKVNQILMPLQIAMAGHCPVKPITVDTGRVVIQANNPDAWMADPLGSAPSSFSMEKVLEPACPIQVWVVPNNDLNAHTDGSQVWVSASLIEFSTKDELALVLGHEFAHIAMRHREKKGQNWSLGWLAGFAADVAAAAAGVNTQGGFSNIGSMVGQEHGSVDFEMEADYVALYIVAKAGLPIDNAPEFWRKMATRYPSMIEPSLSSTHPSSAQRYLAMQKAVEEINKKKAQGKPLEPEKR